MNGDIASAPRAYLYKLSLDSFRISPWLGAMSNPDIVLSKHSELLDLLAGLGIFGFLSFIASVWGYWPAISHRHSASQRKITGTFMATMAALSDSVFSQYSILLP